MRKIKKKSFDWYGMKQHFSIRKYHFGAASVLLGMSLAVGAGAQTAQAETTTATTGATTLASSTEVDSSTTTEASATGATTTTASTEVATAERTATIEYTVEYQDESGKVVSSTVKSVETKTTDTIAIAIVTESAIVPEGYELAANEMATASTGVIEAGHSKVVFKVVKKAEEKAATSETTTTASTETATAKSTEGAATTTATVSEAVKTPATVEEAKTVLEQVTSEAEVLANEGNRIVATDTTTDTSALKAVAAATKLVAKDATSVLQDTVATLDALNAQITAVRTSVEALALELRKFLGTDVIEIALNTSLTSGLKVGEGEGILVEKGTTATPSMDDANGAGIKPHTLRTGVTATTEPGWYTFDSYDLYSYNENMKGTIFKGTEVNAYMRFSLDSDPNTNTILAELVSKTGGQVLERHTIDSDTSALFTYPKTIDTDNENILMRYETKTAVDGSTYGTLIFNGDGTGTIYNTTIIPVYQINTTTYKVEDGRILALYNLQTIAGQTVTSSGQREFEGYEFVEKLVEPAQGGYPVGSKYVAGRVNTATDKTNTIQYKVIRTIVSNTEYVHEIYVLDPTYTGTVDWDGLDTRGFFKLLETSSLSYTPDRVSYDYNTNSTIEANYTVDPETGFMVFAESPLNDQGSKYRVVAQWSGNDTTGGRYGRIYIASQVWTKANTGVDTPYGWQMYGGTFVNLGYRPFGIQQTLRGASTPAALTTTYVYRALEQEAIIRYQVEGATDYLEDSGILTGGSGTDINYSTEETINKYKKLGYELVSDNFTTSGGQDYDTDTAVLQEFLVVIKPRVVDVPKTAVPGEPVDPTDPNSPVWPDTVKNQETTQAVTRTVEYKYEDGTPVRIDASGNILPKDSTEGTPLVKTQTVTFTRPAQVNLVTGEITYGEWSADSTDVLSGNLIPEITDYTATRTTLEGADAPMTETVKDKTVAATDADINEVVYFKENPKYGDVVVNYVNTDGKVIATPVVDTNDALVGTDYSTADRVPEKIVEDTTGDVYYYKEIKAEDAAKETGKVVEGTTEVTYVYEKAGNVVVNYVDTEGNVLKDPVADVTDGKPGSGYDTVLDNKLASISVDGKLYRLAPANTYNVGTVSGDNNLTAVGNGKATGIDATTGTVEAGVTKEITYVYEEVKGDVIVEYYDTEGNTIAKTEVDTPTTSVDTPYETYDHKPATITVVEKDGSETLYYYKEVKDTSAPEKGDVVEGTTTVQYVYEKAGNVNVNYVDTEGNVIQAPVADVTDGKPDSAYATTDHKPEEITTADGKTYRLVAKEKAGDYPVGTVSDEGNLTAVGNGTAIGVDSETGTVEAGKTKEITYVYEEVKGDVIVHYVDTEGNPISGTTDEGKKTASTVTDTPESSTGTPYDTTDLRPNTITTADGKIYKRVPAATIGKEDGEVVEGTTEVTYVYELLQGDVIVHYVDTEGNTIADDVTDQVITDTGTDYDTKDNKPEKIVNDETGDVYYILPKDEVKAGDKETGKVVEGTTEVTYIYEKAGDVVIKYVDVNGVELQAPVADTTDGKPGSDYNTAEGTEKPTTITTADGKVYALVPAGDYPVGTVAADSNLASGATPTGTVEAGVTKEVTYVYQEVKSDVVVEYYNTDGEVIAATVVDEDDKSVGTVYNTDEDNRPETITTADGTVYYYKEVKDTSAPTTGKVAETTTTVQYVYEKAGSVNVNYVDTDGNPIQAPVADETNEKAGTEYATADNKPSTITTEDGKTYRLVEAGTYNVGTVSDDNNLTSVGNGKATGIDATTGTVEAGTTKEITYVYEEVKGNVVVNYITTDGTVIKQPVEDTPSTSTGTPYDTKDNKPTTITTEDGKTYRIVPVLTKGSETGKVVEGTTSITYVYEEVKGDVVVEYYDTEGNLISGLSDSGEAVDTKEVDTPSTSTGTAYNTDEDHKPNTITTADGTVYYYKEVKDTSASTTGKVVEGTTTVQYVYEKAGNVIVHYITEDGTVIKATVTDEENAKPGKSYDTTDNKPTEIVTEDGSRYVLIPSKTIGTENGTVEGGKTIEITYVYKKVANWVPQIPGVPAGEEPKVPYPFDPNNPDVPVTPTPDTVIPNVPGYTPVDPKDNTPLKPVDPEDPNKGYVPPTPDDSGVDTPVPYVQNGNVVVNYVDENGNVLKTPVNDETDAPAGKSYDTTDNKPVEIVTEDGSRYVLIPSKTIGTENGTVEGGKTIEITYVYKKVANWVPQIPGVPEGQEPKVPYPFDPTNPDVPVTPTPDTVIPNVPGYTPVDPKTNEPLKPVDPTDPGKGYVPPTPDDSSVDTPIPYVQNGNVVVNYVTEDGTVIKTPVNDETDAPAGKSYDTTDNKPTEIVTEDGSRYVLIPSKTVGSETGTVEGGKTIEITYVYKKVANWIPQIPGVPAGEEPKVPYPFDPTNPDVPVTPTPDTVIPNVPGYTPVDPKTNEPLKPVDPTDPGKGYVPPTPDDSGVDTPVPYVQNGNVVVNYVTEDGTVIKTPVNDETDAPAGKSYDTTDNKPVEIVTEDGSRYVLIPSKTVGSETGTVEGGKTTEITYVYKKVANWVPQIPGVPEGQEPKVPYPFDPNNPDVPVTPTPDTVIPNVPGYTPVDPKTNEPLKPVDPTDPGKGYVPPTPEDSGVDTPIPYVQNGNVVVNYVTEDGTVIKTPVNDETDAPAGKSYDTTDNKPNTITTEDGTTYELVRVEGSETGTVVGGKTTEVTYVYRKVETPAKKVVTNHVDEDGNPIAPQEEGTTPNKSIPGYEFTGKTVTDPDGNTTHIYRKVTKVVTNHVDEDGNPIAPQEEGTTPNKSIPGYEFTGKTVTDPDGNTTHIYRKVSKPVAPKPQAPVAPTTAKAGAAQLPNTGEASSSATVLGAGMLIAALALAGKRRRNED
ncbi:TPA: MucBP domain-containing protein [Streptococcus suis]|nr:MucBP domain-containing protein [Streptococcus suis]